MPRISVIVPIYNVERYVGECLESLRRQSFDDFEVICVDDGSTDSSRVRAEQAAAGDGRFVFVERPNGGLSAARNTGLDHATGDYVCFLDSDDAFDASALARLHEVAVADNLDLVDFSASTFFEDEDVRERQGESYDYRGDIPGVMTGPDLFVEFWKRRQYVAPAYFHFVRRSMLEESGLRFCEGILHEDELFTPLVYADAKRARYLNEPLYRRRIRPGSIMTINRTIRNVDSVFVVLQMLHAWIIENGERFDAAYVDAFMTNIAYLVDWQFQCIQNLDAGELEAYLATLDVQSRIAFDLYGRLSGTFAQERFDCLTSSRSYKLSCALAAGPRALRDKLARPASR